MSYKQAILVRNDLKLPKGKLAAQCSHAAVEAALKSSRKELEAWRREGMTKVVLRVQDLRELRVFEQEAKRAGFTTALIRDAGHTVVRAGTVTCLGIGPEEESKLDALIGQLKLI